MTETTRRVKYRGGFVFLACVAALGLVPSRTSAQVLQLTPYAGVSSPSRISMRDGAIQLQQKIGLKVGALLTVTFNQRLDLLTSVGYTPGYALVRAAGKRIELGTSSQMLSGSAGARYWLLQPTRPLSWVVDANVGVLFGGEPAYDDLFEVATVSGTLGTALRYQIGQIVSLHLRIQERLFRVRFGTSTTPSSSRPLRVSFGVSFPFLESSIRPVEREGSW
jgi:hypothetical protein